MRLRVATVCSGIGAPEKALTLLGIPYELVTFSEIDEAAIKSYCAIHNIPRTKNFGDLAQVGSRALPSDLDLLVGGTPCQSFSVSGKGEGGDEGSGTRSSLMWNYLQFITLSKPSVVVWENVPGVLTYKHIHNFRKFYYALNGLGYAVHVKVVNAKYFNLPQNRERVFVIAIKREMNVEFDFPYGYDSGIRIKHILQDDISGIPKTKNLEKMELFEPYIDEYDTHRIIRCGDLHWNLFRQNNIIMSIEGISECLLCSNDAATGAKIYDNRDPDNAMIRRFTPFESMRLMGFSDEDYKKCRHGVTMDETIENVCDSELYKQSGNSIAVNVMAAIFGELYEVKDWQDKVFGARKKTPEQLMYEMPLFAACLRREEEENAS